MPHPGLKIGAGARASRTTARGVGSKGRSMERARSGLGTWLDKATTEPGSLWQDQLSHGLPVLAARTLHVAQLRSGKRSFASRAAPLGTGRSVTQLATTWAPAAIRASLLSAPLSTPTTRPQPALRPSS